MQVRSLGWEDPLEEGMAAHANILAWRIPWTEEPGGLRSTELQLETTEVTQHAHMYKDLNVRDQCNTAMRQKLHF